jgi:hypothetical protein
MSANSIPETQKENDIDSVFHSYSHNKNTDGERDIELSSGQNALDEVLRRWDITLNDRE